MAKKIIILLLLIVLLRGSYSLSDTDIFILNQRQASYPLGRLLDNKATAIVYKFLDNFFESIDINRYLFASHPRERPDKSVFDIYMTWPILICLGLFFSFLF